LNGSGHTALAYRLPRFLRNHVLHFEASIEAAVESFSLQLPPGARLLDAGAGESRHAPLFAKQQYVSVDLAVGDAAWNYRKLDCIADLAALPFASGAFDALINIVTLEHLPDPARAMNEMARVLRPGAEWRVASDDPTYQAWVSGTMAAQDMFEASPPATTRPEGWPPTRYEAKALRAGRTPLYWTFTRQVSTATPSAPATGLG